MDNTKKIKNILEDIYNYQENLIYLFENIGLTHKEQNGVNVPHLTTGNLLSKVDGEDLGQNAINYFQGMFLTAINDGYFNVINTDDIGRQNYPDIQYEGSKLLECKRITVGDYYTELNYSRRLEEIKISDMFSDMHNKIQKYIKRKHIFDLASSVEERQKLEEDRGTIADSISFYWLLSPNEMRHNSIAVSEIFSEFDKYIQPNSNDYIFEDIFIFTSEYVVEFADKSREGVISVLSVKNRNKKLLKFSLIPCRVTSHLTPLEENKPTLVIDVKIGSENHKIECINRVPMGMDTKNPLAMLGVVTNYNNTFYGYTTLIQLTILLRKIKDKQDELNNDKKMIKDMQEIYKKFIGKELGDKWVITCSDNIDFENTRINVDIDYKSNDLLHWNINLHIPVKQKEG